MTCKEVSTLVSMDAMADAPVATRLAAWLHLSMCRHCRAFRRQLLALRQLTRRVSADFEREPRSDFESRIVERLTKR
ncbi:MAG: hypothetical protein AB7F99_15365 [Vicinamibacterales bacterium]